jgi:ubiquinone/menaquinone biosynthesis C-methylase UbiE
MAQTCQCDPDGLHRLLRALCALQVCRERPDGRFELTASGEALRRDPSDGSASLRALALWWGGAMWPVWGDLAYSVRTGLSARTRQTGSKNYSYLDQQPGVAALFHEAMQAMTAMVAEDVAQLDTWRAARKLVDVGGGNGTLATALAFAHRQLHVTVLDRADARPAAESPFFVLALAGRTRFLAGDFFHAVPEGADHYLLKSILHNWDDSACRQILAACASAAGPGTRLLVVERIRPERLRPTHHDEALARTDLNMLAGLGGRERTQKEFDALLSQAGFERVGITQTRHEFSVIEAQRI